jgi:signal transduction histidine kinase/ligand-binding sensor domain-containing protein
MGTLASRRPHLLRFDRARGAIAATLGSCLTCVLLMADPAHALDPNKRITQYMHTSWRTQDGSLPAGMYHIAQTPDGFIWLLSLPGNVYRFDGIKVLAWRFPTGVPKSIANLYADHNGGLWLIGGPPGIFRVKDDVVTSQFDLDGKMFQAISEAADGSLWVLRRDADAPLCHLSSVPKCFGKADGIPISPIDSLVADGKGGFWLGGETALVHWHDGTSETYSIKAAKAGGSEIRNLALAPDGTLWVGLGSVGPGLGLMSFKDGELKSFVTPAFDGSGLEIGTLLFDRDGNLWVGTVGKGLFRIHGNVVDHYDHTNGLSGDSVWALFEDREGMVWTGTTSGIDNFRDPAIATFAPSEGLPKDLVAGILASRDGSIWVANSGSLDHIVNGSVSSIRTGKGLPGEQVAAMLEDHAGNLWVGVDDRLYLLKNGTFHRILEPNHEPLGMVISLTQDVGGNIWAACKGKPRKLVRIRDFEIREVIPEPEFPPAHLAADPHGGIWIGTRDGQIVLFRNGVVETKFPLNPGGYPVTFQIVPQNDGSVLASSENGLVGWRQGTLQRLTTKNGLPCNEIITFTPDKENQWWLYTRCGVVELRDSELRRWWTNPDAVLQTRIYDQLDGAQPNLGSFSLAAISPDDRIWFANGLVVQVLDPSRLAQKAPPAETYIESFIVDRKEFPATANLKVPPRPRDLQINYTSPTFLIPQRVKFRYRLDPYDHDWHEAGTRREAFYTDLPPRKYSFRVTAANSDGVWAETPATLEFSVAPAYYQTNWFRALFAVLLLALLWATYRWRVRQLHHQFEMTLDARVGERTRIARDLHDTLLQSFHGVLLRFQTAFQLLPERPVEAKEKLGSAIDQAAEAITEGRDAVQGLRESTTQTNDLALAISTLGEELASDAGNHQPQFRVAVEGESRNLHPILRDETYKIAAEALRNAFQHAQARQVEVEIRYDNEQFRLRVRDDGKGIDPEVLSSQGKEGHFGLPGMRERAKIMGAKLIVWSEVDAGTEVELRLPASIAYATAREGSWFSRTFARKT